MKHRDGLVFQAHFMVLTLISCLVVFLSFGREFLRAKREAQIAPLVKKRAHVYRVDPYLVLAIISVESNFKPYTRGGKGEIGLMQLMPTNAFRAARVLRIPQNIKRFYHPKINIALGCWYLSQLKKHPKAPYLQQIAYLAAEYNGGWANTRRWIRRAKRKKIPFLQAITFPSTRQYVYRVKQEYLRYKAKFFFGF